jgi:hypothetical protein
MLRPNYPKIGGIKLTFEVIESLLGMDAGSIRSIEVKQSSRKIIITHSDTHFPTQEHTPGCEIPVTNIVLDYVPVVSQIDKEKI